MCRRAMRMFADDPETETLLLVSKAPTVEVVQQLADALPEGIHVVAALVGWDGSPAPMEVHATLEAAAFAAANAPLPRDPAVPDTPAWRRAASRRLLGLFSFGGSLAHEALTILEPLLGPIGGNVGRASGPATHRILDLREEEYTHGRAHPMVDLRVRLDMLTAVREQHEVGCVLMDVVLGYGAHPDPAHELASAIRAIAADIPVIVRVCGTAGDPQHAPGQEAVLRDAGAIIAPSNAAAARLAAAAVCGGLMRILLLTYSVRPRGGVVHTLELAGALQAVGHDVTIAAMARPGEEVFRPSEVPLVRIEHRPTEALFDDRIAGMQAAYRAGLREPIAQGHFDIVHAQDCLSANAALDLRDEGCLPRLARTVHHVDDFTSPSLIACQARSIIEPDLLFCVSAPWAQRLWDDFAVEARVVRNGVDTARHRPPRDTAERDRDRLRFGWSDRFVCLTVGGVEPRKGSITLIDAFARVRQVLASRKPLLVIAGGATLFDYRHERERFAARLAELGCAEDVHLTGTISDAELAAYSARPMSSRSPP